jgi:DNA-binding response OmpR family regulator
VRIVLLSDKKTERDALLRALEPYRVEAVQDEAAALKAIARESPRVIVFSVPAKGGPDLARRLHAADASGQAFQIAILDSSSSGKELVHLIAAGVHDFIRRPVIDGDLLERVKAPARLIRWARSLTASVSFDFSGKLDLSQLRVWPNLGTIVADELSQMAGQALSVSDGWPRQFQGPLYHATLPMSLAGDQLEVRISIVVDAATLAWIRETLLGDVNADQAATDDALRELANTASGAFKRAAACENIVFTTGLPVSGGNERFPGNSSCWSLSLSGDAGCLALAVEVKERENQRVPASQLTEGMVLAHDLRNDGGILLVPAGARLTGTSAAKLARLLGDSIYLEVAPAA